jgi:Magnesium chelatase, subunit ChlI
MLARRLTTILPAMTLPEAIETTRIHRVAGRTGDRTAFVTTRPCRAPHHTISDVGLIGGARYHSQATCHRPTMGCAGWMHGRSAAATSWRSGASPTRRASHGYNLPRVLNLNAVADLALQVVAVRDSGTAR